MRRQEQVQAEYDKAEDDVFAKVAMKEKLEKEVCGGQGPGRAGWREMGGVERSGRGGKKWEGWREEGRRRAANLDCLIGWMKISCRRDRERIAVLNWCVCRFILSV